jgi:hypothetical protein
MAKASPVVPNRSGDEKNPVPDALGCAMAFIRCGYASRGEVGRFRPIFTLLHMPQVMQWRPIVILLGERLRLKSVLKWGRNLRV